MFEVIHIWIFKLNAVYFTITPSAPLAAVVHSGPELFIADDVTVHDTINK